MSVFQVRKACDADSPNVVALVDAAYQEYPNCILDVDAEEPELRAVASRFHDEGGEFWVAVPASPGELSEGLALVSSARSWPILGSAAVRPVADRDRCWELKKMYVAREVRRTGVASSLLQIAEDWILDRGARELRLWSDSRFHEAHGFYLARGFERGTGSRRLQDLSDTTEYPFAKRFR